MAWANSLAKRASLEAMVTAVGMPRATSLAKVGPESTAKGVLSPNTSLATSCSSLPLSISKPLVAQARRSALGLQSPMSFKVARKPWLGTTTRRSSQAATSLTRSNSIPSGSGKGQPGRKRLFSRSLGRGSSSLRSTDQSCTARPLRAREIASAVPQEPAPTIPMGFSAPAMPSVGGGPGFRPGPGHDHVEVDGLQQQGRHAALQHQLRYHLARIGEQDAGAVTREDGLVLGFVEAADGEEPGLMHFHEEGGALLAAGLDRDGEHHFHIAAAGLVGGGAHAHVHLGIDRRGEHLRGAR